MLKRTLVAASIALLAIAIFAWLLNSNRPPEQGESKADEQRTMNRQQIVTLYDRITPGMTREDVDGILGKPVNLSDAIDNPDATECYYIHVLTPGDSSEILFGAIKVVYKDRKLETKELLIRE